MILTTGSRECLLNDISASGARITLTELPHCAGSAFLRFWDFEVFCAVQWVHANQCGLLFADRLPRDVLFRLRDFADNYVEIDRAARSQRTQDWVMGRTRIL